ncbi:MAG: phosphoribosyl-AMP cyclohydrolase [Candidatus Omnitrophota bacterium]
MSWIENLKFDEKGLMPAVIQSIWTREVLMVGFMNKESIINTLETGKVHFFSRSRNRIWLKGETSGFTQSVKAIYVDCDMDCLLIKVMQKTAACHTGHRSCFYRQVSEDGVKEIAKKVFDPDKIYRKG